MATGMERGSPVLEDHGNYLLRSEFEYYCDVNEKALRREFESTHNKIDAGFARVDRDIARVDNKIDALSARVDRRFEEIDRRFEQVDRRFAQVDMAISNLSALFHNSKIHRLHQKIQAIQIFDPSPDLSISNAIRSPEGFPMKVDMFLNINNNLSLLTMLCNFYNIDWESWDDSFDSTSPHSVEDAVQAYPELAQRDLADKMGLDLDHLDLMRTRLQDFRRGSTSALSGKRTRTYHSSNEGRDVKRERPDSPQPVEGSSTQPQIREQTRPPLTTAQRAVLEDLLRDTPSLQSPSSKGTQLGWELDSAKRDASRKKLVQDHERGNRNLNTLPLRSSNETEKASQTSKSGSTELL